jgi:AraC-like DNA-binding protein
MARILNNDWEQLAPLARFDAGELAGLCGISLRQLQRDFQRQLAQAPQEWLNEQRLKTATRMLLTGQPVKVVAWELGYKQPSHFCRQFKDYHQLTPKQFVALELILMGKLPSKFNARVQGSEGAKSSPQSN